MASNPPDDRHHPSSPDGLYASFIEGHADPVISLDTDGIVVYVNPAAEAVLGYDAVELIDTALSAFIPDMAADRATDTITARLSTPQRLVGVGSIVVTLTAADGTSHPFTVAFQEHTVAGDSVFTGVFRAVDATTTTHTKAQPATDASDSSGGAAGTSDSTLRTFRNVIEHAGHAIYVTDTEGIIEYVNPAFTEHTGYTSAEVIGETPAILSSGKMSDAYYESLWKTIQAGEVWEEEIVDRQKDGSLYYAHQTIAPVLDDDGTVSKYVAIQTDVTERKRAQRRLKQYREIVEQLDDPIMLQNRDGEFELVNDAVSEFAGVPRDHLYGDSEPLFMDEETAATIEEKRRQVIETAEPVEYTVSPEFRLSDHDATFSTRRYPYFDTSGTLQGTFAICRDVTPLKEREETLEQYEQAINGATDLIAAIDREEQFIFANPKYREYHEIAPDDIRGLSIASVLDDDQYSDATRHIRRAINGQTVEYRTTRAHPTRGMRTFDVRYYPLESPDDDEIRGVVGVLRDVTDRENRARQLSVVDRVLQHNLRNALTVIRGRASQLASLDTDAPAGDVDPETIVDAASYIVARADTLLETSEKAHHITEMLGEPTTAEPTDIGYTVDSVVEVIAEEFPEATLSLSVPQTDQVLASATSWIARALDELIQNAIEHHDGTEPVVSVSVREREDHVRVIIADDGPGLTGMNRDVLETGEAVDALYHGSGLGLWLVYWTLQQSGGSATVTSGDDRGTEITVQLPKPQSEAAESAVE